MCIFTEKILSKDNLHSVYEACASSGATGDGENVPAVLSRIDFLVQIIKRQVGGRGKDLYQG